MIVVIFRQGRQNRQNKYDRHKISKKRENGKFEKEPKKGQKKIIPSHKGEELGSGVTIG